MQPFILMLLSVLLATLLHSSADKEPSQEPRSVLVRGSAIDNGGAYLAGLEVVFIGTTRFRTRTSDVGYYEITLAPGIYEVEIQKRAGFCPLRRSSIDIRRKSTIRLDLFVLVCGVEDELIFDEKGKITGEREVPVPRHGHDLLPIPRSTTGVKLAVRFGRRDREKGRVKYSGTEGSPGARVVVTYDVVTIVADRVCLEERTMTLRATGSVLVQDGSKSVEYTSVRLSFRRGKLIIAGES